jgi:DNA (cytosine-5)-methyltransferase 1
MFPEFVRAVLDVEPAAFVAENVPALATAKFQTYLATTVIEPLARNYSVRVFGLRADSFGVPQVRKRIFLVGFRSDDLAIAYRPPTHTHTPLNLGKGSAHSNQELGLFDDVDWNHIPLNPCMGVRQALGLEESDFDALAPTIRSSLTGPRHTTSILNSVAANIMWKRLRVWPNGVAATRENARRYPAPNGHYRLSVEEVALIQGFPRRWSFHGAVYMALGQIGNAVPPPMAYNVARSVARAFDVMTSRTSSVSGTALSNAGVV